MLLDKFCFYTTFIQLDTNLLLITQPVEKYIVLSLETILYIFR